MSGLGRLPGWSLAALAVLLLAGCDGVRPDVTPPKAVTDLLVSEVDETSVTLTWTAPENDGQHLKVEQYDLRHAEGTAPRNWESGTRVPYPERPQPPGKTETVTVSDLVRGQEYVFALRSADRSGNWSPWSNTSRGQPADDEPPSAIADLQAEVVSHSTVVLTWTATGDDGEEGSASAYLLRHALATITEESWEQATPMAITLEPSPAGTAETLELTNLTPATDYWFAVRAVDDGGNLSPLANPAHAPTPRVPRAWIVAPDGSGDQQTVQGGIDASIPGDTVLVRPGRYYENIDFLGKDLVVRSLEGPEVTILDGSQGDSSVVTIRRLETRAAMLEGFTITGGRGTPHGGYPDGGGLWVTDSSPVIRGNRIVNNQLQGMVSWGAGMFISSGAYGPSLGSPLIEENEFIGNESPSNGGAIGMGSSNAVIRRNIFKQNRSGADGGAIWLLLNRGSVRIEENEFWENVAWDHGGAIEAYHGPEGGPFYIQRNLFVHNEAKGKDQKQEAGGAISARGMKGWISQNTIIGNYGSRDGRCGGGGIYLDHLEAGVLYVEKNIITVNLGCGLRCREHLRMIAPVVEGNMLWGNEMADVTGPAACIGDWTIHNMVADPLLCDPENDDYRVASNSPALQGEEVIGAYPNPGCGPRTAAQPSQWGLAPVRHR